MSKTYDSSQVPERSGTVRMYLFNQEGFGEWTHQTPGDVHVDLPNNRTRKIIRTDKAWAFQHMQDYRKQAWTLESSHVPVDNWPLWGTDRLMMSAGPGRLAETPISVVLDKMVGRDSLPFTPGKALFVDSESSYMRLARHPLTKAALINPPKSLDSDFSIWFLIRDLKDLPKLALQIRKIARKLKRFRSKDSFKTVSESHLATQFGLLPTIADIKDFIEMFTKWGRMTEKRIEMMKNVFTAKNPPEELVKDALQITNRFFYSGFNGSSAQVDITCSLYKHTLYQTSKYYLVMPELSGILNRMKQLTDDLGLLDPSAAWDLIPWSFVIDWVFNVSDWLHRNMKPKLLPADLFLCDWCESIHSEIQYDGTIMYKSPEPDGSGDRNVTAWFGGKCHSVARKRQYPASLPIRAKTIFAPNSIISLRRTLIGVALVGARNRVKVRKSNSPDYHHRR